MINPDLQPLPPNVVVDPEFMANGSGMSSMMSSRGGGRGGAGMAMPMQRTLRQIASQRGVQEPVLTVRRFDFVIQFAWIETPPSARKQKEDAANAAAGGIEGASDATAESSP